MLDLEIYPEDELFKGLQASDPQPAQLTWLQWENSDLSNTSSDLSPETVPCRFWSPITDRLCRRKNPNEQTHHT